MCCISNRKVANNLTHELKLYVTKCNATDDSRVSIKITLKASEKQTSYFMDGRAKWLKWKLGQSQ